MCSVHRDAAVLSPGEQKPSPHDFQISSPAVIILELRKPTDFFTSPSLFFESQTLLLGNVTSSQCASFFPKGWMRLELAEM